MQGNLDESCPAHDQEVGQLLERDWASPTAPRGCLCQGHGADPGGPGKVTVPGKRLVRTQPWHDVGACSDNGLLFIY